MLLSNDTDLFCSIPLRARLERCLQLLLMCDTDLDRVEHFVEDIVHANDLEVLKA